MPKRISRKEPKQIQKPIEMIEVDRTEHQEGHMQQPQPKSRAWYKFWSNKCPACSAAAHVVLEPAK